MDLILHYEYRIVLLAAGDSQEEIGRKWQINVK